MCCVPLKLRRLNLITGSNIINARNSRRLGNGMGFGVWRTWRESQPDCSSSKMWLTSTFHYLHSDQCIIFPKDMLGNIWEYRYGYSVCILTVHRLHYNVSPIFLETCFWNQTENDFRLEFVDENIIPDLQ